MLPKGSWKSTNRTPLGDISNGGRPSRDAKKKIQLDRDYDGGYFDRLLLLRSKLSALVNQIDEIFAQSSEHDMKSKPTNEDIESLSNLLSEMHSSLEPWILRLNQPQTTRKTQVQICKSLQKNNNTSKHRERRNISPRIKDEEPNLDMIISPSPLVAWRAGGCKLVTGKQLFLLTPLSKFQKLNSFKINARNLYMKNTNDTSQTVPETMEEFDGPKPCIAVENRKRDEDKEEALEWFLSPPKTCTLMDPNHGANPSVMEDESAIDRNPMIALTMDSVDALAQRDDRIQIHDTLEWFLSPPKTCALMDPLMDGKIPSTPAIAGDSVLKSRRAGENTLKKELWTKFQAVPMGRIFYRDSVLKKAGKKGFMDMLEEAT